MKTIKQFSIVMLTLMFIVSGSSTMISYAEGGAIKTRAVDAGKSVKTLKFRIQTPGEKRFDGKWWSAADSDEQRGFIIGYIDCYYDTVRRRVRSKAITEEYQKALSEFYAAHPDKSSSTVPEVMAKLVQTLKTTVQRQPGGEVWNERHGYLDGQWWRESTERERIGFLEGYTSCYQQYVKTQRVRFSLTAEEYSERLTKYCEDPSVDHTNEKIAKVLHRLAAR
jgi:hypothetical protein